MKIEKEYLKELAEKAAAIAMDTAEKLKHFSRDTAMVMYGSQLVEIKVKPAFTGESVHKKMTNEEANKKLDKMMEQAKTKWQYATEADKKKAKEMEQVVLEGKQKIKKLYEDALTSMKA